MTIRRVDTDWYSVTHRGCVVADFATLIAAEAYVRRLGWNPIYG